MHYTPIITIKVTKEKETHTDALAVDVIKQNKQCIGKNVGRWKFREKTGHFTKIVKLESNDITADTSGYIVHCFEILFLHFSVVITAKAILLCFEC